MTLKVLEFSKEDIEEFDCSYQDKFEKAAHFNLKYPEFRPMYSFKTEEGKIVAVLGASFISHGVWEGWVFTCKDINKHAKSLVREARDFSDWALSLEGVHRIQIAVLEENRKWAQSIGFQFESIVKNYHSNKDHFMYIKVGQHGS